MQGDIRHIADFTPCHVEIHAGGNGDNLLCLQNGRSAINFGIDGWIAN